MNALSLRRHMDWSRLDQLAHSFFNLLLSEEPTAAARYVTSDFTMFGVKGDDRLFREASAAFGSVGVEEVAELRIAAGSIFDLVNHVDEARDIGKDETVAIAKLSCGTGHRVSIALVITADGKIRRIFDPVLLARAIDDLG